MGGVTLETSLRRRIVDLELRELKVTGRVSGLYDLLHKWRNACSRPDVRIMLLNALSSTQRTELELATDRFLSGQGYEFRDVERSNELIERLRAEVASLRRELSNHGFKATTPMTEE